MISIENCYTPLTLTLSHFVLIAPPIMMPHRGPGYDIMAVVIDSFYPLFLIASVINFLNI